MKTKTQENILTAFIGEAKAYFRLLAYADRADEEDVPRIAALFRAIADAERVHATRMLNLVKDLVVKDTDTNLEKSLPKKLRRAMPSSTIKRTCGERVRREFVPSSDPPAHGPRRVVAVGCPGRAFFRWATIAYGFFIDCLLALCCAFKHAVPAFTSAFARCIS